MARVSDIFNPAPLSRRCVAAIASAPYSTEQPLQFSSVRDRRVDLLLTVIYRSGGRGRILYWWYSV